MFLEQINGPDDLKKINIKNLDELAEEIRKALIIKMSSCGGHLSSNLGVVEATIALHYVFNSPKDKFVFDVSHQCYTHKILTGRKEGFICPEKYREFNGYTNPLESEHDLFRVGHTATSISLACGLAKARDLNGGKENVIAFIGDGSLSGGEAFEGLDYAGSDLNSNFIIVFNDNQMSIAEDHGGIYKNLYELRKSHGKSENNLFKAFGYEYVFVEDGNDIQQLIEAFKSVKDIDRPVVVHICTTKGKGYKYSEEHKESTHWVRPFEISSGQEKNSFNGERYDRIVRDYLIEKMKNDSKVVTMIAAVPDSLSFSEEYRREAGKQFIDVGICEEHAISMAAGLAKNGCKPVFVTMSTFYQRTYDQISQELCINKSPVTMIVVNASVYATNDVTHIGIFDIPMMSNIPELVYLAPTNKQEYLAMIDWSLNQNLYPVAIRAPRNGVFESEYDVKSKYDDLNKYKVTQEGSDIAVLALGDFYQLGQKLCREIAEKFNLPTLINPMYITGVDTELLNDLKKNHRLIITLEDGILDGGFGEKIARFYGADDVKVLNYGLKKEFLDRYNVNEVMEKNRLRVDLILEDIERIIKY